MSRKIYIITRSFKEEGLFAIANSIINHCEYAIENGYVPVVDLKHYSNQYFKDGRTFKDNSWEYFFEQPNGIGLDDIKDEDEVTIGKNKIYINSDKAIYISDLPISHRINDNKEIEKKKLSQKSLLKFNKETKEYLEENFSKLVGNGDDVLGILCRGTDYINKKPVGEEIQPKPETVIKKTKEVIKNNPQIKRIYVATEDNEIYQKFKKEFGDILIENCQYKYSYKNDSEKYNYLSDIKVDRKDHNYNLAKEYLLSIYILSKCRFFIGGRTTGTKWAWLLSEKWEYFYIWKLGKYGKSILQQIFSVYSEDSGIKKYKVYNIFGIKIKKEIKNQ